MSDSIERILDDAKKKACAHFGFENKPCEGCPSKSISNSCRIAQRIDLVNRTRALFERQLPGGVEWPRFEDGELVQIGDEAEFFDGEIEKVLQVFIGRDGYTLYCETKEEFYGYGTPVKRPEHDTQEKIDADARKSACEYFGWEHARCDECPASSVDDTCDVVMIRDLLRRQRELCEREAG